MEHSLEGQRQLAQALYTVWLIMAGHAGWSVLEHAGWSSPPGELAVMHWMCCVTSPVSVLVGLLSSKQGLMGVLVSKHKYVARRPQPVTSADNGGVTICCQV